MVKSLLVHEVGMIGKKVIVTVDRPIGYEDNYGNVYLINYGYVDGIMSPDAGNVIAIIERIDDIETKWIVSNESWTKDEI